MVQRDDVNLAGRICLVTGSGRGIGAAIIYAAAARGAAVVINYLHSEKEAQFLLSQLQMQKVPSIAVRADVSREEEVIKMFETIENELGEVDLLVNNAGVSLRALIQETTTEQWEKVMGINLKGTFLCCRQAVPAMVRKKFGRIVNIASTQGGTGASFESVYAASKGGIIALSKSLGDELGPSGITVNAISPGPVAGDMLYRDLNAEELNMLTDQIPLGRIAQPEDIAQACMFLLSSSADYINGQVINIDGGWI